MSGQHFKFTNTNIKNLPTPDKRTFYYDTVEPKLSIQITPNGAKSFYIRQRVQGRDTRVKLGSFPEMTIEEAAEYLKLKPNTLERWRVQYPDRLPFVKIGRTVKYRLEDLQAFITNNRQGK